MLLLLAVLLAGSACRGGGASTGAADAGAAGEPVDAPVVVPDDASQNPSQDLAEGPVDIAPDAPGPPPTEARFGFQLFPALQLMVLGQINEKKTEETLALLSALDVRWLRIGLSWKVVEGQKGTFDWKTTDKAIERLSASGLKLLVLVGGAPDWAGTPSPDAEFTTPDDPADFAAFLTVAAGRYKGKVQAWELWNEPNVPNYWGGKESTPEEYLALLAPAAAAVRAADPQVTVVGGCPLVQFFQAPDYTYLDGLLEGGVLGHVDAFSAHIYPPMTAEAPKDLEVVLGEVAARVKAHGPNELWLTEVGAPSKLLVPPHSDRPDAQADMAEAVYAASHAHRMFWFQLIDGIYHCGVVDNQLVKKPAYDRLLGLAAP